MLSVPGLFNIYSFLRDRESYAEPGWLKERLRNEDPSAVVSHVALEHGDRVCSAALDLLVDIYGSETGNLALKCLAVGGVYVAGGIAPKILAALQKDERFLRGYLNKGRFAELLKGLAVRVALNQRAPLLGAAHYGLSLT